MSTYIYVRCDDHTPPLMAQGESGQHLSDLPQLRSDIANRERIVAAANDGMEMDHWFRRNTLWFLQHHPNCSLSIHDEYGREYPLIDEEVDTTPPTTPEASA